MLFTLQHVTFAVLASILLYYLRSWLKVSHGLPPGPKPLPIVGNILDLPPKGTPEYQHWIKFKALYGPISSVTVLGTTLVILHSNQAANEILGKKSTKTSGRPSFYFADEMCGFGGMTSNLTYSPTHRLHRKLMHQQMGTKKISERFYAVQDLESRRLLLRILEDPTDLMNHIRTEASAIILRITYGYSIEPHKPDPLVNLIQRMMDNFTQALIPLSWPVDMFTYLKYLPTGLPGTAFKETARQWKDITRMATEIPYAFVLGQMAKGASRPSYVASLVGQYSKEGDESGKLSKDEEDAVKSSAAIMYGGGADTTVATIISFVLAMIHFPDVQQVAQKEIDNIVGVDRLPGFEDRERLPYVNALIKETLRWVPVAPIGPTHVADEEITYSGYRIPKGAYIIPAIWWFLHDPETYPNPDTFDPERFLEPRNEPDPAENAFGYGRRICPGRYLADDNLFLAISRLLAVFHIEKAVDDKGQKLDAKLEVSPGLIGRPESFPYSIKPRSTRHAELIRSSETDYPWEESDAVNLEMDPFRYLNAGSK